MPLPPDRDHRTPVDEAKAMTRRYRDSVPKGTFRAGYFHMGAFMSLLNQRGCRGIRIYLGRHENGSLNLIMVGVDGRGRDMLPGRRDARRSDPMPMGGGAMASAEGGDEGGEAMQDSFPCPTLCDDDSPLNGDD